MSTAMTPTAPLLGQVALVFRDVAAAKRFYVDAIGLTPLFDAGPNLSFLAAGSLRFMLTVPSPQADAGRNSILYFKTDSAQQAYDRSLAAGASAERAPALTAKLPDHELWIAFVRDPEGNLVGWMEERR